MPRTLKGWMFGKRHRAKPEGINDIRNRGTRQPLRLRKERITSNSIKRRSRRQELCFRSVKTLHEALQQTLELEVVKQVVGISSGL
jgi:hypothetical protein